MILSRTLHLTLAIPKPTKYPVVLCHGLSGFDSLIFLPRPQFWRKRTMKKVIREGLLKIDYWYGIQDHLQRLGVETYISRVSLFGTIDERAAGLHNYLESQFEPSGTEEDQSLDMPRKINLIAHSMGGLDSRYLISKFNSKNYQVASVTTVSTPHRGSEVADFVLDHMNFPILISKAVPQLTTYYMAKFNQEIKDDPKVKYFSYGAEFNPHWYSAFHYPHYIIRHQLKKAGNNNWQNDGLVSVESAKWGEYLGTLKDVDHLDLINWTNRVRTLIDKLSNKPEHFNALYFYSCIIDNLNKRGF